MKNTKEKYGWYKSQSISRPIFTRSSNTSSNNPKSKVFDTDTIKSIGMSQGIRVVPQKVYGVRKGSSQSRYCKCLLWFSTQIMISKNLTVFY